MRNILQCLFFICTALSVVNVKADIRDCGGDGKVLKDFWLPIAVESLEMQGVKFSPFLAGIYKLFTQPGGDGGKLVNNYQCSMAAKDPSPKEEGWLIKLFTPKSNVSVEDRVDSPDNIYILLRIPLGGKPAGDCYSVHYTENGTESKTVGYAKFTDRLRAVMSCY